MYSWPNGRIYEGNWFKGNQHGEGKLTNSKRQVKIGIWEYGVLVEYLDGDKSTRDKRSSFGAITENDVEDDE